MSYIGDEDWYMVIEELAEDWIACDYCGARPGHACRTKKTRQIARDTHAQRSAMLRELATTAYQDGIKEGKEWEKRWPSA